MIGDMLTVIWKERKGLFVSRGSRLRAMLNLLVPLGLVAIWFPVAEGPDWVSSPVALTALLIPMLLVATTVPDSFAGERERHTLSTLLASRLPDRAILFGKLAVAVAYGWIVALIAIVVALLTVNVAHWQGHVILYSPAVIVADVVLTFQMAMLVAGVGILISLRAASVQAAQQLLVTIMLVPPIVLAVILTAFHKQIASALGGLSFMEAVLIAMGVLIVVDVIFLLIDIARFQRARLILG
jgi:ABC-2 type transport system permease protein